MAWILQGLIPVLWISWLLYWGIAAVGAKPTQRSESFGSRMTYVVPLMLGGALLVSSRGLGPLNGRFLPSSTPLFWTAIICVAAGLVFTVVARVWLGRNWSANVTLKQDHELVRTGPYGIVRHPIYTGLLLAFTGTALAIGEWRALVALVLFAGSFVRKIAIEERFMAEQFGDEHARYAARVSALIPCVY